MFYKIIDEKTKKVDVGLGINTEFYKSIGMVEGEVEKGYDGNWYVKGYAPQKSLKTLKQEKIQELKANCSAFIYSKYPIYKQLNVANGLATEEETSQMRSYINQVRSICNGKESQINFLEKAEDVKVFDVEFIIDKNNNNK